jgi:DNA mismatch repair protein MSH4
VFNGNARSRIILILLGKIRPHFGCMYKLVEAISIIDMIQSFAEVSKTRDYVRPMFGAYTKLIQARHPVIDLFGQQKPIANNIELCQEMNVLLVTGPNMSGKSTYLRQIALLQILAQIGKLHCQSTVNSSVNY